LSLAMRVSSNSSFDITVVEVQPRTQLKNARNVTNDRICLIMRDTSCGTAVHLQQERASFGVSSSFGLALEASEMQGFSVGQPTS
jgi:hypothetical protein